MLKLGINTCHPGLVCPSSFYFLIFLILTSLSRSISKTFEFVQKLSAICHVCTCWCTFCAYTLQNVQFALFQYLGFASMRAVTSPSWQLASIRLYMCVGHPWRGVLTCLLSVTKVNHVLRCWRLELPWPLAVTWLADPLYSPWVLIWAGIILRTKGYKTVFDDLCSELTQVAYEGILTCPILVGQVCRMIGVALLPFEDVMFTLGHAWHGSLRGSLYGCVCYVLNMI